MPLDPQDRGERLDSWKAIAGYLGRDVRTLIRWEKEKSLPVHRVPGGRRQAVFAYKAEIDDWLQAGGGDGGQALDYIVESGGKETLRNPAGARQALLADAGDGPRPASPGAARVYPFPAPAGLGPELVAPKAARRRLWAVLGVAGAALGLAALVIGLNAGGLRDRLLGPSIHPRINSLAVLPLENLSRDPDQEYFADGMTDELITDLAKIGSLRVISRTSAMQYKGTRKTLPEIARELNVDAVVEGTVQRSGNRVLISAQLIHAPSDRHLWAESYDRDLRDMLGLESEVAVAIATEIKAQISPQEQVRLASARPVNPEAHELDLRGLYYFEKDTPEGNKKAVQYFQKAIATDANDALAYALLAEIYDGLGEGAFRQMPREEAFRKAEAAARHAIQLDETVADAHSALAIAKVEWDWDWQGAEAEFKRAIELAPGEADPYHQHIMLLTPMGRHEEAIVEIRKGESLDPADVGIGADAGWVLNYAHLYDQAIAEELKILEMEPGFALAHLRLGESYTQKGLYKEALAEYKKWSDLSPGGRDPEALVAYTYARMGRTAEALKIVNQLKSEFRQGQPSVAASDLAQIYTALGDKDQALAWLETSIEKREEYPPYMRVDPALDPLHSDPRFQDLVRRMRFPE